MAMGIGAAVPAPTKRRRSSSAPPPSLLAPCSRSGASRTPSSPRPGATRCPTRIAREPGDHHVCTLDAPCGVCHIAVWVGPAWRADLQHILRLVTGRSVCVFSELAVRRPMASRFSNAMLKRQHKHTMFYYYSF